MKEGETESKTEINKGRTSPNKKEKNREWKMKYRNK